MAKPLRTSSPAPTPEPPSALPRDAARCPSPLPEARAQELWKVTPATPQPFLEARRCLAQAARAAHDSATQRRALLDLVNKTISRYDPAVLVELALLELNGGRADDAVKWVIEADRHTQRLAAADTYGYLTLIQQIKGNAYQLKFEHGQDSRDLDRAMDAWRSCASLARERKDDTLQAQTAKKLHELETIQKMSALTGRTP